MTDANNLPARYANGRFGPGNPGRPVGSYSRASRRAALAILEHFDAEHETILDSLISRPNLYIALLSRVLPKQIECGPSSAESMSDVELSHAFSTARVMLDGVGDRRTALSEIHAVLLGEDKVRNR